MSDSDQTAHPAAGARTDAALPGNPLPPQLSAEVLYQGAMRAMDVREYRLAASLLQRFVAISPDSAKALTNLGFCYFQLAEYARAEEVLGQAVALRPDHIRTLIMHASVLFADGRAEAGARVFARVLTLPASSEFERTLIAQVRLMFGDDTGWDELESRWSAEQIRPGLPFVPSEERPLWDGSPQPDRTLCVHAEGGFGDTIMFSRYLPAAAERVGRVAVAVSPPLARLLAAVPGVDEVIVERSAIPADALHTSFPSLLSSTGARQGFGVPIPFFRAPPASPILPRATGPRIGLVWAGSTGTTHDVDRSCPSVDLLAPLIAVEGTSWISLQVGDRAGEADRLGIEPTPALEDFADTAGVVEQLDLVITIDSAVAHLAGSLGIPTWIMIPTVPEYRWPLDGEATPWYPRARLFRRRGSGDWARVVERIRDDLTEWRVRWRDGAGSASEEGNRL